MEIFDLHASSLCACTHVPTVSKKVLLLFLLIVVVIIAIVVGSDVNLLTIFENLGQTDKQTDRQTMGFDTITFVNLIKKDSAS